MTHEYDHGFTSQPYESLALDEVNLIDHVDTIIDYLDTAHEPNLTTRTLSFDRYHLNQGVYPEPVAELFASGSFVEEITISTRVTPDSPRYGITLCFSFVDRFNIRTNLTIAVPEELELSSYPVTVQSEAHSPSVDNVSSDDIAHFLYSMMYTMEEMETEDFDALLSADIRDIELFDRLLVDLQDKASSHVTTQYYRFDVNDDVSIDVQRDDYVDGPEPATTTAIVALSIPTTGNESICASTYLHCRSDTQPAYFVHDPTVLATGHRTTDISDGHIKQLLGAVREAVVATGKGQDYFVSVDTLEDMFNQPYPGN